MLQKPRITAERKLSKQTLKTVILSEQIGNIIKLILVWIRSEIANILQSYNDLLSLKMQPGADLPRKYLRKKMDTFLCSQALFDLKFPYLNVRSESYFPSGKKYMRYPISYKQIQYYQRTRLKSHRGNIVVTHN